MAFEFRIPGYGASGSYSEPEVRFEEAPGFAAVGILTLALGIGVNTAISSVIDATLLKPLPYPGTDRLVLVWQTCGGNGPDNINIVSALNMMDVKKQNTVLESMAWFESAGKGYNLAVGDVPERVSGRARHRAVLPRSGSPAASRPRLSARRRNRR
jgi:hypothetical protein